MDIETLTVYLSSDTFPANGNLSTSQTFVYNDLTDVTFNLRDVNRGKNNDYIGIYKTEFNFDGTATKFFNSTLSAVNGNYLYVPPPTVNNLYGSDFQGVSAQGYAKFYYSNGNTSTIILNVYKSDFNVADSNLNLLGVQSFSIGNEKSLLVIKDKHNNSYTMSNFTPITPTPSNVEFTFNADWIMVTYKFTDGLDLDTRSRIVTPNIGQVTQPDMVGWGYPADEWPIGDANPIIAWAGDNLGTGFESVLIDINRLKTLYPSTTGMVADFRAFWYNEPGIEPVFGAFTLWKGGVPVLQPAEFTWTNPTATKEKDIGSASLVIPPGIPDGFDEASTTGYRLVTLTYNITTGVGVLNNADTTTPNVPVT